MMLPDYCSMDWFKGKFTGKPHISWENLWFPVDISTAPRAFLLAQGLHPGAKASARDFARLRPK